MRRDHVAIPSAWGPGGDVVAYGTWGRPVLVFPSEAGRATDFEDNGMLEGIRHLIDEGRAKLYCVDSHDAWTWSDRSVPVEERARRHLGYESWVMDCVVPWIGADCGGSPGGIVTAGMSMGAFHAVNFAFKRADVFPVAIGMSGHYDAASRHAWGDRAETTYFNNPMDYVANLDGGHLAWLRGALHVVLVVGEGAWEVSPTQALPSTRTFAALLACKAIPHDLDVWGPDTPHDWPSWRRQLAKHLPRFC